MPDETVSANHQVAEAPSRGPHGRHHRDGRRPRVFGLAASLLVHALLLLSLAFVLLDRPAGSGAAGDAIKLAIVTQTELSAMESAASSAQAPAIDAAAPTELLDATLFDAPVADAALESTASSLTGLEGAGKSLGEGMDLGGGAGGGAASFFGVEARGTRFAFIVDISGSMTGPKLQALKRELVSSIEGLSDHASFSVVFFSSTPRIIGGRAKWIRAGDRARRFAIQEINSVDAGGATNPLPAMQIVFDLRPRPDAIYFMTDGQFSELVVHEFARMNGSWIEPIPIHTISFVSREAEGALKRIADASGGTYTHIPGPGQ